MALAYIDTKDQFNCIKIVMMSAPVRCGHFILIQLRGSVGSLALEYHKSVFTPFLCPYVLANVFFFMIVVAYYQNGKQRNHITYSAPDMEHGRRLYSCLRS